MPYTLADLDEMSLEQAQDLPFDDRDQLLDLIIAAGRHQSTDLDSYRVGLYCDYFEEDLLRMHKVGAIKVHCRGTTSSGFDGVMVGESDEEQYRACFRPRADPPRSRRRQLQPRGQSGDIPHQHGQLAHAQRNLPRVRAQPALPRRNRHHWSGPKPPCH